MSASSPQPPDFLKLPSEVDARPFHDPSVRLILQGFALGFVACLLLVGVFAVTTRRADPPPIVLQPPPPAQPTATPLPTATPAPIVVFVSGAVAAPGLYTLAVDARVGDALDAAGGLGEDANLVAINQAERLWDGAQVHVPVIAEIVTEDAPSAGVSGGEPPQIVAPAGSANGRVNINTADVAELTSLPGIGATKAEAIIAARPYASVDDLDRASGIGAKTVEQLRDLVTVE
ncbi:MAG: ComEA family DNA-binding protein [Caldilineaceae bacterium]